ncbi:MAG TPA: FAD-dependent oxidoreductase [Pseudonocardiaceae bacterium]
MDIAERRYRIVVLGAGYAGLPAAKRLARQVHRRGVEVTLISRSPQFVERPRLHQLATGQQVPSLELAELLGRSGARLLVGRVAALDVDRREVLVDTDGATHRVGYDTLVYALGSTIDVDTVPGVRGNAHTLAGPEQAARFHARATELAGRGGQVLVCGGGLTGIEAATEIAETYPALCVELVSLRRPGWWLAERARRHLDRALDRLDVAVHWGSSIVEVGTDAAALADGTSIRFDACLWAGGFTVPRLARDSGLTVNGCGRIVVDRTLRSVSHRDIYAAGDAAAAAGRWGEAMAYGCRTGGFMGPYVADAVADALAGRTPRPFRFRYIHQCVSLGRHDGLVQFVHPVDESPRRAVLTGGLAVRYKDTTLGSAIWLFRHPGPYLPRRGKPARHTSLPDPAASVRAVQR